MQIGSERTLTQVKSSQVVCCLCSDLTDPKVALPEVQTPLIMSPLHGLRVFRVPGTGLHVLAGAGFNLGFGFRVTESVGYKLRWVCVGFRVSGRPTCTIRDVPSLFDPSLQLLHMLVASTCTM